jgi:serine/threonine protein kinase
MTLAAGTRLGPYEVSGLLGVGGMGEVYRATDTKLGREVAIKTLPAELATDKDRLARFEREAKLLAALNHAHIASVYSLAEHDGTLYIAMELVDGVTLERKLSLGRLQMEEALQLALQIAEALEAAHEKGVIHRDLKPANIMVSRDGRVKVLDFGLAKAFSADPKQTLVGQSPALSVAMTQQGLVLGTAGYMSPEQASGQATDQRSDVWAFAVVLYEMLTGRPTFTGESVPHILADVLKTEPDWSRLPKDLHPRLKLLLERCLEKKVRNRYHSVADVRVDIERALRDPHSVDAVMTSRANATSISKWAQVAIGAVVAMILTASAFTVFGSHPSKESSPKLTFELSPPDGLVLSSWEWRVPFDISSDARWLAFIASKNGGPRSLWVRDMSTGRVQQVAGTEGAHSPFWSRDGHSVAFWLGTILYRVKVPAGVPERVTRMGNLTSRGKGSWSSDGKILLDIPDGATYIVPAEGGTATLVSKDGGLQSAWLSDSVHYLSAKASGIYVDSIRANEPPRLVTGGDQKLLGIGYVPGYLFYDVDHVLWVDKFDETTLKLAGSPRRLASDIPSTPRGQTSFSASAAGVLVYWTGALIQPAAQLLWVDRSGNPLDRVGTPAVYDGFDVSPDGTHVVASHAEQGDTVIWVHDVNAGNAHPLAFNDRHDTVPIYSSDGKRLTYLANPGLKSIDASGFGTPVPLVLEPPGNKLAGNWNSSDKELIYEQWTLDGIDLVVYHSEDHSTVPVPWNTSANETAGRFSPDDRWVAYVSDQSERNEVWVAAYPSGQPQQQVSIAGGTHPEWSGNGSELFYISPDGQLTSVPFSSNDGRIVLGEQKKLFAMPGPVDVVAGSHNMYKPSVDGQRFLIAKKLTEDIPPLNVIVNWKERSETD